jgi:hypothetical protein
LIEPGGYDTEWRRSSAQHAVHLPVYAALREGLQARMRARALGNPDATADALLQVVDADDPPKRLLLGSHALETVERAYAERLDTWRRWSATSASAQGDHAPPAG